MKISLAWRVWQRHAAVFRRMYLSSVLMNFVEPMLFLGAMGLGLGAFVQEINGLPYIQFIAPGIVANSAMYAASFECTYGTFVRMTFQKTFDAILATPVGVSELIVGEIMWAASKSVLYGTIIILVISAFGLVSSPWILLAIPILFLVGLLFAQMAMVVASLVPGIDSFSYYFTLVITPLFLFSETFFPLDTFPVAVQAIGWFTPLYHAVNIMRGLAHGDLSPLATHLPWIIGANILLAWLPFIRMKKRLLGSK